MQPANKITDYDEKGTGRDYRKVTEGGSSSMDTGVMGGSKLLPLQRLTPIHSDPLMASAPPALSSNTKLSPFCTQGQMIAIGGVLVPRFLPERMRNRAELEEVAEELREVNLSAVLQQKSQGGEAWLLHEQSGSRPKPPPRLRPLNYQAELQKLTARTLEEKGRLAHERRERLRRQRRHKLSQETKKVEVVLATRQRAEEAFQAEQESKLREKESRLAERRERFNRKNEQKRRKELERQERIALQEERARVRALREMQKLERARKRKQLMLENKVRQQSQHLEKVRKIQNIKGMQKQLMRNTAVSDHGMRDEIYRNEYGDLYEVLIAPTPTISSSPEPEQQLDNVDSPRNQ